MFSSRGFPWGELRDLRSTIKELRAQIADLRKELKRKSDYFLVGKHVFFPNIETMVLNGPVSIQEYRAVQHWMDDVENITTPDPLMRYGDDDIRPQDSWRIILTETSNPDTMGPS